MIRSRRLSCGNDESHFEKEARCSRRRETLLLDNQDPEPKKTEGMLVKPITRTDSDLMHLEGLTELRYLGFDQTQITEAGLAHLKGLTGLQMLNLWTRVTDVGLGHLNSTFANF